MTYNLKHREYYLLVVFPGAHLCVKCFDVWITLWVVCACMQVLELYLYLKDFVITYVQV
jgi:hypothetical protein